MKIRLLKYKIFFIILFVFFGLSVESKGQFLARSEIGLFLGGSNYMGELNDMSFFGTVSPAGGLLYRYTLNDRWVIKANALYGGLKGGNPDAIEERNLSFKSYVFETSLQVEFNFLRYLTGSRYNWWAPYIFAGVGFFSFNPKAYYTDPATNEGTWYELRDLGTEGQGSSAYPDRKPYSLIQFTIPMGIGFKFSIAKDVSLGVEYGIRKTFTDYLDDVSTTYVEQSVLLSNGGQMAVILADRTNELDGKEGYVNPPGSQRGKPENKDWYAYFGLTLTMKMGFMAPQKNCNNQIYKYYSPRKRFPNL